MAGCRCSMLPRHAALLLVVLLGAVVLPALGQVGGTGPKVAPNKSDIKYIRCQVCELLAKNAYKQVKDMFKEATPSKRVTEEAVIERMEKITNPVKEEGEWVTKVDLVEKGSQLLVKEMNEVGECGVECKTVERAAQDILDDHDTDVAEALFTGKKNRAQFSNWLCYELTDSCSRKPPPLPKDRPAGPAFMRADPEKLNMDRMLASMREQGMRGSLMSREEAMAQYKSMGGEDGEDEDDLDEDELLPPIGAKESSSVTQLASAAVEAGQQLLGKVKESAAPLLESASEGLGKVKAQARGLWDSLVTGEKKGEGKKSGASAEL